MSPFKALGAERKQKAGSAVCPKKLQEKVYGSRAGGDIVAYDYPAATGRNGTQRARAFVSAEKQAAENMNN